MCICNTYVCIYIYIYRERERYMCIHKHMYMCMTLLCALMGCIYASMWRAPNYHINYPGQPYTHMELHQQTTQQEGATHVRQVSIHTGPRSLV